MSGDDADRRRDAERLRALEAKLGEKRVVKASTSGELGRSVDQANLAWRMVVELVAGIGLGLAIGLGLDWLFGTRPIMLVVFVLAGFAAGVKTMMRTAREVGAGAPQRNEPAAAGDDEDDD